MFESLSVSDNAIKLDEHRLDANVCLGPALSAERLQEIRLTCPALAADDCHLSLQTFRHFSLSVIDVVSLNQVGHRAHQKLPSTATTYEQRKPIIALCS